MTGLDMDFGFSSVEIQDHLTGFLCEMKLQVRS